jgi:hypothetical protein
MALQLASNPLVVASADLAALSGDLIIYTGYAKINHMEYIEYNSSGDRVEVQDINQRLIWAGTGESTQDPVWSYWSGWTQGLRIPQLKADGTQNIPSGKLMIYVD